MSSNSGSKEAHHPAAITQNLVCPGNCADLSVSEAVSNISSPDYQDDENLMSSKDMCGIGISDLSDSDSTILVSDMATQPNRKISHRNDHKIMIKVRGMESSPSNGINADCKDSEDELTTLTEDVPNGQNGTENGRDSSPPPQNGNYRF